MDHTLAGLPRKMDCTGSSNRMLDWERASVTCILGLLGGIVGLASDRVKARGQGLIIRLSYSAQMSSRELARSSQEIFGAWDATDEDRSPNAGFVSVLRVVAVGHKCTPAMRMPFSRDPFPAMVGQQLSRVCGGRGRRPARTGVRTGDARGARIPGPRPRLGRGGGQAARSSRSRLCQSVANRHVGDAIGKPVGVGLCGRADLVEAIQFPGRELDVYCAQIVFQLGELVGAQQDRRNELFG